MRYEDDLQFAILGPIAVHYDGHEIPVRSGREQMILASLLLAGGRTASVGRLVETVWEADPPPAAAKAVRNSVSSLRSKLAEAGAPASVVRTEPDGYRLQLDGCYLDAEDFRSRVADARQAAATGQPAQAASMLRDALGLWRGPALAGLDGPVIEAGAASLGEQHLAALEDCLELELAMGKHRESISELQALAGEHPLQERFAAQLMTALYRSGRQAEALEAYRRLATRLAEDLGIDPAPEVTALHEAILRQDPALNAATPRARPLIAPPPQPNPSDAEPPRPQDPPSSSPRRGWLRKPSGQRAVLAGASVVAAITVAGMYTAWSLTGAPARPRVTAARTAAPAAVPAARDNTDPYADGCRTDEKSIDWEPVRWPGGRIYGTLILRYSPACQAVWGYLNGPNSTAWTIHIIPVRLADHVSAPWTFSGNAALGSWSNVLSARTGCVYVEAYITDKAGTGPQARTPCFGSTGTPPRS